jgi:hypothetical protein
MVLYNILRHKAVLRPQNLRLSHDIIHLFFLFSTLIKRKNDSYANLMGACMLDSALKTWHFYFSK